MSVCTGDCCERFALSGKTKEEFAAGVADGTIADPNGPQIAEMIIPLEGDPVHFLCRNFDLKTRLCTIYESRPNMCRHFPYDGEACSFGCKYVEITSDVSTT